MTRRNYRCRCGRPIFFGNSQCLACGTPLGYDPERALLLPLHDAGRPGLWRRATVRETALPAARVRGRTYRRCANLETASACNWLVGVVPAAYAAALRNVEAGAPVLCRACRLTRKLPDLTVPENATYWRRIADAQRRLVAALIGLGLPVRSRVGEDPERGLAFDLLRAPPEGPPVVTGHADGVITIDVAEADDAVRERRRTDLHEPYRTLLGHLRHESGHYYWQRLVDGSRWLEPFRALFGDERSDYAAALRSHYESGPKADWPLSHVSAYASSHPWEDWAETWAHYLHVRDTLETARSFGLDGEIVALEYEPFGVEALGDERGADAEPFLALVKGWMELTGVLNELSRSMGVADFYPFVWSVPALRKLYFVHRVIGAPLVGAGD